MWRAQFGRGFGPVVRQTAKWMMNCQYCLRDITELEMAIVKSPRWNSTGYILVLLYEQNKGVALLQFRCLASCFPLPLCTFNSVLFLWHLLPLLIYESCPLRGLRLRILCLIKSPYYLYLIQWYLFMLATVGSIQSRPNYTGGELMDTTWHWKLNFATITLQISIPYILMISHFYIRTKST